MTRYEAYDDASPFQGFGEDFEDPEEDSDAAAFEELLTKAGRAIASAVARAAERAGLIQPDQGLPPGFEADLAAELSALSPESPALADVGAGLDIGSGFSPEIGIDFGAGFGVQGDVSFGLSSSGSGAGSGPGSAGGSGSGGGGD